MPDLNTTYHVDMLRKIKSGRKRNLFQRLWRAIKRELTNTYIYGVEWGDPDTFEPLKFIRDQYVLPYVNGDQCAVEIGPGGGRWTQYLLGFRKLYVVDYHAELLEELKRNFNKPNMEFIKNNGSDFPGVSEHSIDYIYSFGTFVHLDTPLIDAYLASMKPILKSGANVVLQYSDKTKIMGQKNKGFSENTPEKMRHMVSSAGYKIIGEDLTTLWHSSIILFTI